MREFKKIEAIAIAFYIILLSYACIFLVYKLNKNRFGIDAITHTEESKALRINKSRFGFDGITYADASKILRGDSNFNEKNYIISSFDNEIKGYKFFYFSKNFCSINLFSGDADLYLKEDRSGIKVSLVDRLICVDLFGSPLKFNRNVASDYQVTIMGFYSSIILSLLIFCFIFIKSNIDNKIAKYGVVLILVILIISSVVTHFMSNFTLP